MNDQDVRLVNEYIGTAYEKTTEIESDAIRNKLQTGLSKTARAGRAVTKHEETNIDELYQQLEEAAQGTKFYGSVVSILETEENPNPYQPTIAKEGDAQPALEAIQYANVAFEAATELLDEEYKEIEI